MPDLRLRLHKDMLTVAPLFTLPLLDESFEGSECLELLNIFDDELVRETHRRFKAAGAECAITNTLGANQTALSAFGLEAELVDINRAGVRLAREVGFQHIIAAAQIAEEAVLSRQVEALLSESPDALLLAGIAAASELEEAIKVVRAQTDLPLIAPAMPTEKAVEGQTVSTPELSLANGVGSGYTPDSSLRADIVYLSDLSLAESLQCLQKMARGSTQQCLVCPSLGKPEGNTEKQRSIALSNLADELMDFSLEVRQLGVQFVGTAAGSSPVFTGVISAAVGGLDVVGVRSRN